MLTDLRLGFRSAEAKFGTCGEGEKGTGYVLGYASEYS